MTFDKRHTCMINYNFVKDHCTITVVNACSLLIKHVFWKQNWVLSIYPFIKHYTIVVSITTIQFSHMIHNHLSFLAECIHSCICCAYDFILQFYSYLCSFPFYYWVYWWLVSLRQWPPLPSPTRHLTGTNPFIYLWYYSTQQVICLQCTSAHGRLPFNLSAEAYNQKKYIMSVDIESKVMAYLWSNLKGHLSTWPLFPWTNFFASCSQDGYCLGLALLNATFSGFDQSIAR